MRAETKPIIVNALIDKRALRPPILSSMDHSAATIPTGEDDSRRRSQDAAVTKTNQAEIKNSGDPYSTSWREEPLSPAETLKVTQIIQACKDNDRQQLIALAATPGGFIEDHIRRLAWPILLGEEKDHQTVDWQALPPHHDEDQVKLDVHRAFVYYPTGESEQQIEGRKRELSGLITGLLRRHSSLCYFQGFHDIAQVLLLVLGSKKAAPLLARLSLLRIRDFMLPSISATSSHLQLLPAILYAADPKLCRHLSGLQPYFALAATLTLYAHDIEEYGGISRLFDFLLAREAVVSVYMYATIIMTRKDELFEFGDDEPEMLYAILSKLPKPLDIESLISRTTLLFSRHPPETLSFNAWRKVSSYSVLKTTRNPTKLAEQTLKQGEIYLEKHSAEIERHQKRQQMVDHTKLLIQKYRKPAGAITLAVLIGVISLWLGRTGNASSSAGISAVLLGAKQRIHWIFGQAIAGNRT